MNGVEDIRARLRIRYQKSDESLLRVAINPYLFLVHSQRTTFSICSIILKYLQFSHWVAGFESLPPSQPFQWVRYTLPQTLNLSLNLNFLRDFWTLSMGDVVQNYQKHIDTFYRLW